MDEENSYDLLYKIVIIGDTNVGKSNILSRYLTNEFTSNTKSTVGVELGIKFLKIKNTSTKIQIWDTAGQERFRGVTKNFMKGADGIIYAYDVTKKSSFESLKNWIFQSEEATEGFKKIIIGNKIDLEKERQITKETLNKFCQNRNIKGMEVSAKNDINVNECFETLAKLIIEGKSKEQLIERYSEAGRSRGKSIISKASHKNKNKKKCC